MLFGSQLKLLSSILTLCVYYFLARFLHYLADNCVQESSSLFQRVLRLLVDVLILLKALIEALTSVVHHMSKFRPYRVPE